MLKLKSIRLKNYRSFENCYLEFDTNKDYLILGRNNDAAGMDSNESGKSNLLSAIPWVFTGQLPEATSFESILRRDTDSTAVTLELVDGNDLWNLERGRRKSSSYLAYELNGDGRSPRKFQDAQAALYKDFGLPAAPAVAFTDLCNTIFFSPHALAVFAGNTMRSADRIQLISRFLKIQVVECAAALARKRVADAQTKVDRIEGAVAHLTTQYDSELIKNEEDTLRTLKKLESDKKAVLAEVASRLQSMDVAVELAHGIEKLRLCIEDQQKQYRFNRDRLKGRYDRLKARMLELQEVVSEREAIEHSVAQLKIFRESLTKLLASLNTMREGAEALKREEEEFVHKLKHLKSGDVTCPECAAQIYYYGGEFITRSSEAYKKALIKLSMQHVNLKQRIRKDHTLLKACENEYENAQRAADEFEKDDLEEKLIAIREAVAELNSVKDEIKTIDEQGVHNKEEFEKSNARLVEHLESRETLLAEMEFSQEAHLKLETQQSELENELEDIATKISDCEAELHLMREAKKSHESYRGSLKEVAVQKRIYALWEEGFPKVKKMLIANFLPEFQARTNHYLNCLQIPLSIEFRLDLDKSMNEFSIMVLDEGGQSWNIGERSRGMQVRIAGACGLALSDFAAFDRSVAFGFVGYDETLDSLDASGVSAFLEMLSTTEKQNLFISHSGHLASNFVGSTVLVTKEDGISHAIIV